MQYKFSTTTKMLTMRLFGSGGVPFNTLGPGQNGRHFPDDIFKCIFLNENTSISIHISLNVVPEGRINNIPALVQIMAWRRSGDKPLSEPMMVSLLSHICVTRPQWVNTSDWWNLPWTVPVIQFLRKAAPGSWKRHLAGETASDLHGRYGDTLQHYQAILFMFTSIFG